MAQTADLSDMASNIPPDSPCTGCIGYICQRIVYTSATKSNQDDNVSLIRIIELSCYAKLWLIIMKNPLANRRFSINVSKVDFLSAWQLLVLSHINQHSVMLTAKPPKDVSLNL